MKHVRLMAIAAVAASALAGPVVTGTAHAGTDGQLLRVCGTGLDNYTKVSAFQTTSGGDLIQTPKRDFKPECTQIRGFRWAGKVTISLDNPKDPERARLEAPNVVCDVPKEQAGDVFDCRLGLPGAQVTLCDPTANDFTEVKLDGTDLDGRPKTFTSGLPKGESPCAGGALSIPNFWWVGRINVTYLKSSSGAADSHGFCAVPLGGSLEPVRCQPVKTGS